MNQIVQDTSAKQLVFPMKLTKEDLVPTESTKASDDLIDDVQDIIIRALEKDRDQANQEEVGNEVSKEVC